MKNTTLFLTLLVLLFSFFSFSSTATRDPTATKPKIPIPTIRNPPGFGSDPGGFFGPGAGFNIPGFTGGGNGNFWGNTGGGYGGGYGSPSGGHGFGGVVRPSVVCSAKGPCYKKKLICPAKCFSSYNRSGRNYGGGGGGGGCTMDCKKNCVAYC